MAGALVLDNCQEATLTHFQHERCTVHEFDHTCIWCDRTDFNNDLLSNGGEGQGFPNKAQRLKAAHQDIQTATQPANRAKKPSAFVSRVC